MNSERRVAITGLGVASPAGMTVDSLWSGVLSGVPTARAVEGFDVSDLPVRFACQVHDIKSSPYIDSKDVRRVSRGTLLALSAGHSAIEDSKLVDVDPTRASVVCGVGFGGMDVLESQVAIFTNDSLKRVSPFTIPAIMPNAAAAQLSMRLGWRGPTSCPALACAAGSAAIADGAALIRSGVVDTALCGGADSLVSRLSIAAFSRTGAMSLRNDDPAGASRPFDAGRDGFVMAEGAGFLVLEEWSSAYARGARILGEVLGTAQTADAHHLTAPPAGGVGAVAAMRAALADANVTSDEVGHVNSHGTSTLLNDREESAAIRTVFGDRRVPVTATKGVTGHMIGGSGAVEAIVSLLSATNGVVPPTANYRDPDPDADAAISAYPQQVRSPIALTNSLAFGGHNVTLVLRGDVRESLPVRVP